MKFCLTVFELFFFLFCFTIYHHHSLAPDTIFSHLVYHCPFTIPIAYLYRAVITAVQYIQTNICKSMRILSIVQMKHINTGKITVNWIDLKWKQKKKKKQLNLHVREKFEQIQHIYPESTLAKCHRFKSASGSGSIKFIEFGLLLFNKFELSGVYAGCVERAESSSCCLRFFSPMSQEKTVPHFFFVKKKDKIN